MDKIDRVMAKFRKAMIDKFHKKETNGWTGWDEQRLWKTLVDELHIHALGKELDTDNLIDIALLAMFLWNLESK